MKISHILLRILIVSAKVKSTESVEAFSSVIREAGADEHLTVLFLALVAAILGINTAKAIQNKNAKKILFNDKDTLLQNLPEKVVNVFLDFLGTEKQHRDLMLHLIKSGSLVITCDED